MHKTHNNEFQRGVRSCPLAIFGPAAYDPEISVNLKIELLLLHLSKLFLYIVRVFHYT